MAEMIQLTEDLAVAWEGDVEGYAPAIELWNRALVALVGELGAYEWPKLALPSKAALLPEVLPGLLLRAFHRVGAKCETTPETTTTFPYIHAEHGGTRLLVDLFIEPSSDRYLTPPTQPNTLSLNELNGAPIELMRSTLASLRCFLYVEEIPGALSAAQAQWTVERGPYADTSMTARLRCGGAFTLGMGLWMGLHTNASRLSSLKLVNTGPTDELNLDPLAPRLNVITGDNGLGKSFLLESAWFMLTGHWHMLPAVVTNVAKAAAITASLRQSSRAEPRASRWLRAQQGWSPPHEDKDLRPGLVVYARVDGSFSVWDSHRNVEGSILRNGVELPPPRVYPFSEREVMHGLKVWLDDKNEREVSLGLINEWREWQTGNKPQFALLKSILAALGPDGEPLLPGTPSRPYLDDAKDIPTIQMAYGQEVPITLAPAGVKRVAMLAYVLTWAISEHRRMVEAYAGLPARSVVLLIDEPETHLHPRWQRTILPSLLKALEVGFGEPKVDVQMFVATHSPLVLASLEPHFDPALDALWKLDLAAGEVKLERDRWYKRGTAGAWLTSDVFDLGDARSREAEQALNEARELIRARVNDPERLAAVTARLVQVLPEDDPMLTRWQAFVEDVEVGR